MNNNGNDGTIARFEVEGANQTLCCSRRGIQRRDGFITNELFQQEREQTRTASSHSL